jgi:uncharacterized iron-regulated membrane protein
VHASAAAHRTLWRWHFYAGLFVMPLLIVLAVTGTLYCFQPQIEPLLYRDRMVVAAEAAPRLSRETLLAKAIAGAPLGAVPTTAQIGTDPRRSAEFVFRLPSGESESVYVNPYSGALLGTLSVEHRLMKQVRNLHRALLLGKTGELLMELAGCWTLVMIGTGIALWWPGGAQKTWRKGGVWVPRLRLCGRAWWRDLHAFLRAERVAVVGLVGQAVQGARDVGAARISEGRVGRSACAFDGPGRIRDSGRARHACHAR